jgi:predicted dehydrogenase
VNGAGERLRVGIVGAGIRGTLFARALASHPACEVVGFCDPSDSARASAREALGLEAFVSHDELLAAGLELDALVVATPDFAHREPAVAGAQAGLHLLVEKPLATTDEDARAIHAAVEAAGVRCMVGFENRWNPRFGAARELIAEGRLGQLLSMTAHLHDTLHVPTTMLSWAARTSPAWFLMPHSLDLLLWLSGKTPARVYATGVKRHLAAQGIDTWDAVDAMFTFTDGTTATLHSAWVLPESHPAVYDLRVELTGEASALRVQVADQGVHHFAADRLRWPQWGVTERAGRLHGFPVDMAHAFAEWILRGEGDVPTSEQGLRVTELLTAVHRSVDSGAPIELTG